MRVLTSALTAFMALAPIPALAADLVVAWSPAIQTPQLAIAQAQGYLDKTGLDVQVTNFNSGREAFEALLGGQADLASMAEFPAATGILQKQPFRIVGELARFDGSEVIGNSASGPLTSPADLAGRKIGTTLGTNVNYGISTLLADAGVQAEIVNAAPTDLAAALARGDVDAVAAFPNAYPQIRTVLGDKAVSIPSSVYQPYFIMTASLPAVEEKKDAIVKFYSAIEKADDFIAANPQEAAKILSEATSGNVTPEQVTAQWQKTTMRKGLSDELANLLVSQAGWIVDQGQIKADKPDAAAVKAYFFTP